MGTKISGSTAIFLMCLRERKLILISSHNWRGIEKNRICVSTWGHLDFFVLHHSFPSAAHIFHGDINQHIHTPALDLQASGM